jgi:trans-aconitate 2-methyltransferase
LERIGRSIGCGTGEERPVTEWDARAYNRVSALQQWVAEKSLGRLPVVGDERVLDLGCGDGKITIEIVRRLPRGSVVGVDASHAMIAFAARKFPLTTYPNLAFLVADASQLPFADQFDLVVSFNCLHWVRDQAAALRSIRAALVATGRAHLRFVSRGERKALEDVIEDTRRAPQWSAYFTDYSPPYLHLTPDAYRALVEDSGLRVERLEVQQEKWDFESRDAFTRFAQATFVEWTRLVPPDRHGAFIDEVLDRYRQLGDGSPDQANVFTFYQMEVVLRRS